jgi:hypothetical protein
MKMGLKFLDGEKQIMEGKANKSGWYGSRGGKLILTNQRLLFVDHGFNIRQGGDAISLKDIMSVEPSITFLLVMPIPMPTSIKIRTQSGSVNKYIVTKRKKWVEEITKVMNT